MKNYIVQIVKTPLIKAKRNANADMNLILFQLKKHIALIVESQLKKVKQNANADMNLQK